MNISKILKNAPIGTKLYSPTFGDVIFQNIDDNNMIVTHVFQEDCNNPQSLRFYEDGRWTDFPNSECVLFPDKSNTWHNWQEKLFKEGDVIEYEGLVLHLINNSKKFGIDNLGISHTIEDINKYEYSEDKQLKTLENNNLVLTEVINKIINLLKESIELIEEIKTSIH